jgi:hypothetical protein
LVLSVEAVIATVAPQYGQTMLDVPGLNSSAAPHEEQAY